jgi:2,3-bisphosphoglycerate-independent phosphoglycerate mutase
MRKRSLCMLVILDGWGKQTETEGNAVYIAKTPFLDELGNTYPNTELICSGKAVGLPEGIMGNSEVGHLNIGAGRVVYQDLVRIDEAIKNGDFFKNENLNDLMATIKKKQSSLHLMGLVSDGGVHSHLNHVFALIDLAKENGIENVYVHAITDGRDTPPDSGQIYIEQLQKYIQEHGSAAIATICGRYYAMDRDTRWDRTQKAHRLYTSGEGVLENDPVEAVKHAYGRDETDEFISPIALVDDNQNPFGIIRDGDGIVFFNFRADRARQITRSFTEASFDAFERKRVPVLSGYVCMTLYEEDFPLPVAFAPIHLSGILGEVISKKGLRQLRIAETEKYAHVTYFLNGGAEHPFEGEERCLIPSPRDIPTYDHKPEMSALEVTREVISRIESDKYDLIVLNFANMDMVGHTGDLTAAIKACETIDTCVKQIVDLVKKKSGMLLITADHGNAEQMISDSGNIYTAHSMNPVSLILVDDSRKTVRLKRGVLGNIAPTILELMDVEKPEEMTEDSLIVK